MNNFGDREVFQSLELFRAEPSYHMISFRENHIKARLLDKGLRMANLVWKVKIVSGVELFYSM